VPDAGGGAGNGTAATLFLIGYYEFFNLVGALNSSPWTAESFGGDPGKNASAKKYVKHAVVNGVVASGAGVLIGRTWWPLIGTAAAAVYTWWIYDQALARAEQTGSVAFQSPSQTGWKRAGW
jgi:hypothetical protein